MDFIGLHAIFNLPDPDQLNKYNQIIEEMRKYYPWTRTVLVTRIDDAELLFLVYKEMPTDFVQISACMSTIAKEKFLNKAKKIYQDVKIFNVLSAQESDIKTLKRDIVGEYVVLDKEFAGGTGQQISKEITHKVTRQLKGKYILLAGGMGRVNVGSWLDDLNVAGVDIMSSMEVGDGDKRKDINKINEYLHQLRGENGVTLTGFPKNKKQKLVRLCKPLTFQLKDNFSNSCDIVDIKYKSPTQTECQIQQIYQINHFIPISISVYAKNFVEFIDWYFAVDFGEKKYNIDSITILLSDLEKVILDSDTKEYLYLLRRKIGISLYLDKKITRNTLQYIRLFKNIYCDNGMRVPKTITDNYPVFRNEEKYE
ncbi:MAG: hypothetical protein WC069_05040 [Candidatus Shapirobacteria bacterium]